MLSMVSDNLAATRHHEDEGQGEYDCFELFAGETLTLSMVSEDLAATLKTRTRWGEGDMAP